MQSYNFQLPINNTTTAVTTTSSYSNTGFTYTFIPQNFQNTTTSVVNVTGMSIPQTVNTTIGTSYYPYNNPGYPKMVPDGSIYIWVYSANLPDGESIFYTVEAMTMQEANLAVYEVFRELYMAIRDLSFSYPHEMETIDMIMQQEASVGCYGAGLSMLKLPSLEATNYRLAEQLSILENLSSPSSQVATDIYFTVSPLMMPNCYMFLERLPSLSTQEILAKASKWSD